MNLNQLLADQAEAVIEEAVEAVKRARLGRYEAAGRDALRERMARLYELVADTVRRRNLTSLVRYVTAIARERHAAGFDLREVQTAFNVLEEAIWRRILAHLEPDDVAEALGLVSTALGMGKDHLARSFVEETAGSRPVDQRALFQGTDGV